MENDELSTYLASLAHDSDYRVVRVYKEGRLETTQEVYFVGESGSELGPFVRKYLAADSGLGTAYERVFAAQRSGARLAHLPRIVECHREADRLVVVMEHVEGETLAHRVEGLASPSERLALARDVFGGLCDAVAELHERFDPPIIHRDLKPSNVMVSGADVTLIDLGIARTFKEGGEKDTTHFGTRAYAPPEQFGFGQTGVRSDVYALGMVLFFCLTGREPTSQDREGGFSGAGVPDPLRKVIVRATQFDPGARYGSARELGRAFAEALDNAPGEKNVPLTPPTFERERPRIGVLLARVPRWAGAVWDLVVLGFTAVLVVGCVMAVVDPTPQNAAWPAWYLYFSYFVFMVPLLLVGCYLLLDRRPLRREIPALARLTVRQETRAGLLAMLALLVMWILASIAAGV